MNTSMYSSSTHQYEEYSRIEVLQAAGRAGRPQFDDTGVVVIMTRPDRAAYYQQLMNGSETIESQMHCHGALSAHLNAEIAAGAAS